MGEVQKRRRGEKDRQKAISWLSSTGMPNTEAISFSKVSAWKVAMSVPRVISPAAAAADVESLGADTTSSNEKATLAPYQSETSRTTTVKRCTPVVPVGTRQVKVASDLSVLSCATSISNG